MKIVKICLIAIVVFFGACSEDYIATYCPDNGEGYDWLGDLMKDYKRYDINAEIYYYEYKGEPVFSIDDCIGCSDAMTVVYNCNRDVICQFGGIAGMNTCPDFADEAKEKKKLYPN